MRRIAMFASVVSLTLAAATPAGAQDDATGTRGERTQVLSASPLLLLFKWINVDYERKIAPAITLGVSGSYLPLGDGFDYQRATFHARYYPQGAALTGFYMGAQTGVHRAGTNRDHGVFVGGGIDVGYAWLLGPDRNHSVSLGLGLTRMFAGDVDGYSLTIPNVRLVNIGFAF